VAPKPVNVLIGWNSDLTVKELSAMGVRRVSVGGALARAAWSGFYSAAQALKHGRFDAFPSSPIGSELDELFRGAGPATITGVDSIHSGSVWMDITTGTPFRSVV